MEAQAIQRAAQEVDLSAYDKGKFNVLVPTVTLKQISPWHQMRVEVVKISPNVEDGEVYVVESRYDKKAEKWIPEGFGLAKPALMKLSLAAGIIWNWPETKPLSVSRDYVLCQAVGGVRKATGELVVIKATKEIDLTVVEAEVRMQLQKKAKENKLDGNWIEAELGKQMLQWRRNKLHRAETGAMLRVIRALLAIRHRYSAEELSRPFVVPRVDFVPDLSDPQIRRLVVLEALKAQTFLFGGGFGGGGTAPYGVEPVLGPVGGVINADEIDMEENGFLLEEKDPDDESRVAPEGESGEPTKANGEAANEPEEDPGEKEVGSASSEDESPKCESCGKKVSAKTLDYSRRHFGRVLCFSCQKEERKA